VNLPAYSRAALAVAIADVLLTFPFCFAANELPFGRVGPHATWHYWLSQPAAYILIAPVAAVAAWFGVRQVRAEWAGRPHWGRVALEGAGLALAVTLGVSLLAQATLADVAGATLESSILAGTFGLLLTAINYPLSRCLLRGGQAG
jgi:hypothetical protein